MKLIKTVFLKIKQLFNDFIKFLGVSFLLIMALLAFNYTMENTKLKNVIINGEEYPITKCANSIKTIIIHPLQREKFCTCYYEKILGDHTLSSKYKKELKNDNLFLIIDRLKKDRVILDKIGLGFCFDSINVNWTKELENAVIKRCENSLEESDFKTTNNVKSYCKCLVKEYRKFPFNKYIEAGLIGIDSNKIDLKCTLISQEKNVD